MQTIYHRTIRDTSLQTLDKAKKGSWLHIINPNEDDLIELERRFGFDPDLLDDGIDLYEAPRLENEDGITYIYVRYCRPENPETSTEPLLIIVTNDLVVTVARRMPEPIQELIDRGAVVTTQKVKLLLEILERINAGYRSHLNAVTKQIFASRARLQRTVVSNKDVIRFIDTEEDLNEFLAALQPYGILLHGLTNGRFMTMHDEDKDLFEDIQLSTNELIELTKSRLKTIQNMREAYSTIATNNLNQIFKRLTSITIFLAVPTVVGGLYGMNVALPLDDSPLAFWFIISLIGAILCLMVWYFNRKKWL